MQRVFNKRGRQVIDSGVFQFDQQVTLVSSSNMITPSCLSMRVTAEEDILRGGKEFSPGELQQMDLQIFAALPGDVTAYIKSQVLRDKPVRVVVLRHLASGSSKQYVDGVLILDGDGQRLLTSPRSFGPTTKSLEVIRKCIPFLMSPSIEQQ